MKKFLPKHDRIQIKPTPPDEEIGGFALGSGDKQEKGEGLVIAVGDGVPLHNIHLNVTGEVTPETIDKLKEVVELIEKGRALKYKPGDYVQYGRIAGTKLTLNGEDFIIVREADVFGVIVDG